MRTPEDMITGLSWADEEPAVQLEFSEWMRGYIFGAVMFFSALCGVWWIGYGIWEAARYITKLLLEVSR